MKNYLEKPIFIIGYMHSGTSLLQNIVSKSTTIYSSNGETKFFELFDLISKKFPNIDNDKDLMAYIDYLIRLISTGYVLKESYRKSSLVEDNQIRFKQELLEDLLRQAKSSLDYSKIFSLVFSSLAQYENKTRWLEKTPTHIFHIDEIIQTNPDAQFLQIVRDPRDVIASKKTRTLAVWQDDKYATGRKKFKRYEKAFDPLWDTYSWKAAIQAGENGRNKFPDQIKLIKYEDLVTNPEFEIEKICDFLSIPFEAQMLEVESNNSADKGSRLFEKGSRIFSNSIGRWERILSVEETQICQWASRKEIDKLNYKFLEIPMGNRIKSIPLLMKSGGEFFVRLVHRWKLGGFRYFIVVINGYLKRLKTLLGNF